MEWVAVLLPALYLLVWMTVYFHAVFEPYWAFNSQSGLELKQYHAQDLKLRLIAQWWTARLAGHHGGYFDEEDDEARLLCAELHDSLVRHRFIFGDDEPKMTAKGSSVIARAVKRSGWRIKTKQADEKLLIVTPNLVKTSDGRVVWRGKPPEHKSRFNDMYYEWL